METKKRWSIEQILKLVENLYTHIEDYDQGKLQNFRSVCLNCRDAAEIITQILNDLKREESTMKLSLETEKVLVDATYRADRAERENKNLKECIVRMALGRYGVLND